MGNGSAFLQGMLGGLGSGFSEGIGRWTTARDKAAEMAAMAEERKWQREQAAKTFGLHEKQAKTAALDSIRKAIKDNTITPYHEQLIKDYGFTTDDVAPVVNAGFDAEMGWGQQPEAAPAPQEPKVAMTNYTQDNVAGKTIDGVKPMKSVYGTFKSPSAKEAFASGKSNALDFAGKTEGTPGARYTPEELALIKEGKAAAFDQGVAQTERFAGDPRFEAAAKQPWDTYNRDTLVAEAPSQNVQMDNYVTDERTGMVRPASITAPISKPTPNVSMPSPLSLAAQNYASDVAAQKAAQRAHDMAKEQKRYEGKKYSADVGKEGRVQAAEIVGKARVSAASIEPKRKKESEKDYWDRVEVFGRTNQLWQKDAKGNVVTDKNGNPLVDKVKADALYTKEGKMPPGGGTQLRPQDKLRKDVLMKELDKALTEVSRAEGGLTAIDADLMKLPREARLKKAQDNVTRIKTELAAFDAGGSGSTDEGFDSFITGQ